MLCKITLVSENNITLPFAYNNIIQAVLYKFINENTYREFIHDKGYIYNKRAFKLFSFSSISVKPLYIEKEHKKFIFPKEISFYVSSIDNEFYSYIISSIININEDLNFGGNKVAISKLETIKQDNISGGNIKTLSPITIYSTFLKPDASKVIHYYSPYEPEFENLVRNNLINKYRALNNDYDSNFIFRIKPTGKIVEKVISYKKALIKGYSGMFYIEGSEELIKLAFCTGLGSKNSSGFGLIIRP